MKIAPKVCYNKKGPGITPKQRTMLLKCFAQDKMATVAAEDCGIHRHTADKWYRYWREQIYASQRKAPRFFGEIEMDQKAFGGRGRKRMATLLARYKKILSYAEYQAKAKAVRAEHKTQVFGILQRQGDVYAHVIKKADRRTLMPIIRLVVEQGSTVYTDKWRGFTELKIDGYTHHSINHSVEYVNKAGHHSNTIESFWSYAGRRLTKFNGISTHMFPLHLKECVWRFNTVGPARRDGDTETPERTKILLKALKKILAQ